MKENLLDVLMYLFENYTSESLAIREHIQMITAEMVSVGFRRENVNEAVEWFEVLRSSMDAFPKQNSFKSSAIRIYTPEESVRLTPEAKSCLLYLEQAGVIDARVREIVIDRAMALASSAVDMTEIKWISLIVIYNLTEFDGSMTLLEEMVFNEEGVVEH